MAEWLVDGGWRVVGLPTIVAMAGGGGWWVVDCLGLLSLLSSGHIRGVEVDGNVVVLLPALRNPWLPCHNMAPSPPRPHNSLLALLLGLFSGLFKCLLPER